MLTVYGIKQCDTVRKAVKWLDQQGIEHRFHDFRTDGLQAELLQAWLDSDFSDKLVNRRSTTWRKLSEAQRQSEGESLLKLLLNGTPSSCNQRMFSGPCSTVNSTVFLLHKPPPAFRVSSICDVKESCSLSTADTPP